MYRKAFQEYIASKEYRLIEADPIYQSLTKLLAQYLSQETFLEVEELLHSEILFKLELGFQNGFRKYGEQCKKEDSKQLKKE